MSTLVVYLAHPCGAPTLVEHQAHLDRARRWFRWAIDQDVAVIADWLIYCEVWSDFNPELREKGLRHDDAMIAKCDEFWMVGGRISSGMDRGQKTAIKNGVTVRDFTGLGLEPPVSTEGVSE